MKWAITLALAAAVAFPMGMAVLMPVRSLVVCKADLATMKAEAAFNLRTLHSIARNAGFGDLSKAKWKP